MPLASGFLSGKYKPGAVFNDNVRKGHKQEAIDEKLRLVEQIKQNEVPEGVTMAEWALAWNLKNPAVTCVIPGCKNVEQVEVNAKAATQLKRSRGRFPASFFFVWSVITPQIRKSSLFRLDRSIKRNG